MIKNWLFRLTAGLVTLGAALFYLREVLHPGRNEPGAWATLVLGLALLAAIYATKGKGLADRPAMNLSGMAAGLSAWTILARSLVLWPGLPESVADVQQLIPAAPLAGLAVAAYIWATRVLSGKAAGTKVTPATPPDYRHEPGHEPPRPDKADVILGLTERGKPLVLLEQDRMLHTIDVGPTGGGKSAGVFLPLIEQDVQKLAAYRERQARAGKQDQMERAVWKVRREKAQGRLLSVTVIEPKGSLAADVADMCRHYRVPVTHIDLMDPNSQRFNALEGEVGAVAEITRTALRSVFGDQEAFFSQVQQTLVRETVVMLKTLYGDDVALMDLADVVQDADTLERKVRQLKSLGQALRTVNYFEKVVLKDEKTFQAAMGLRQQLADLTGNPQVNRVLRGPSDINLDRLLAEGGVFTVATGLPLGRIGSVFGQLVMQHEQAAVFRRPRGDRPPHLLYVDEYPRYLNDATETLLALGREYQCGALLSMQDIEQLALQRNQALRDVLLAIPRNAIVHGGVGAHTAGRFSAELGERWVQSVSRTLRDDGGPAASMERGELRPRLHYTQIIELPKYHAAFYLVRNGHPEPPVIARTRLAQWAARVPKTQPAGRAPVPPRAPEPPRGPVADPDDLPPPVWAPDPVLETAGSAPPPPQEEAKAVQAQPGPETAAERPPVEEVPAPPIPPPEFAPEGVQACAVRDLRTKKVLGYVPGATEAEAREVAGRLWPGRSLEFAPPATFPALWEVTDYEAEKTLGYIPAESAGAAAQQARALWPGKPVQVEPYLRPDENPFSR